MRPMKILAFTSGLLVASIALGALALSVAYRHDPLGTLNALVPRLAPALSGLGLNQGPVGEAQ